MKRKLGRKFAFAIFCAALCIFSVIAFCVNIKEANAPLLLTMVAAPCLAIIAGVVGVEGAKDIKVSKLDVQSTPLGGIPPSHGTEEGR
jgi:predicted membrane protein